MHIVHTYYDVSKAPVEQKIISVKYQACSLTCLSYIICSSDNNLLPSSHSEAIHHHLLVSLSVWSLSRSVSQSINQYYIEN